MKKEDIEKIMDMSFLLGRKKYGKNVSLVDIYDLSCKIWEEIQNEPRGNNRTTIKYILLDSEKLDGLLNSETLRFDIDEDCCIEFLYKPYAYALESGEIIKPDAKVDLSGPHDDAYTDYERDFIYENKEFESDNLDFNIKNWMIEHKTMIQDVLGFDILNLENDLYGEDNFGNSIVLYGDSGPTTDETLQRLLFNAIGSNSEKVVWIANRVQFSHSCIINWLNMNHCGDIRFYLIEADKIVSLNNKTPITLFRLVESPETC